MTEGSLEQSLESRRRELNDTREDELTDMNKTNVYPRMALGQLIILGHGGPWVYTLPMDELPSRRRRRDGAAILGPP